MIRKVLGKVLIYGNTKLLKSSNEILELYISILSISLFTVYILTLLNKICQNNRGRQVLKVH